MEKIISGQSFLYRNDGISSTVIEVVLKDKISGSCLNRALSTALKRFSYLTQKLVLKGSDYYLEEDIISLVAVKSKKIRTLGSMKTGYHLMDVTYYENKINVSFHHSLCDGRGITPFIETLIYYYCQEKYKSKAEVENLYLVDTDLFEDELIDPISRGAFEVDKDNVFEVDTTNAYKLPENSIESSNYYRSVININKSSLLKVSKENSATPLILLTLLMSSTIKKVNQVENSPVIASIACDLREAVQLSHTYKNCVGSIYSSFENDFNNVELKTQATELRDSFKKQRSTDSLRNSFNKQIGLYNKLDSIKTLEEKKDFMSFFSGMTIDTFVISYLGQINLGENSKYIDSMHLYSSGNNGLILNMISAGDVFSVDMLQSFENEQYLNEFILLLKEFNIDHKVSEKIELDTVKDKAYKTSKFQAEKFYK